MARSRRAAFIASIFTSTMRSVPLSRFLDVVPASLHPRTTVILGSKNEVGPATRYHAG
jgi:fructose-1,6-bisphosphatase